MKEGFTGSSRISLRATVEGFMPSLEHHMHLWKPVSKTHELEPEKGSKKPAKISRVLNSLFCEKRLEELVLLSLMK